MINESTITCDTLSCDWRIRVTADLDDDEARKVVVALGGVVSRGTARDYHHCPKHGATR